MFSNKGFKLKSISVKLLFTLAKCLKRGRFDRLIAVKLLEFIKKFSMLGQLVIDREEMGL